MDKILHYWPTFFRRADYRASLLLEMMHNVYYSQSVIRVYGRFAFVSSRLAASLSKMRKTSSECLSATARQGCEQDAERFVNVSIGQTPD